MYTDYLETPLGLVECKASDKGITQTIFCGSEKSTSNPNKITKQCKKQLAEYFSGQRQVFDLPLDPKGTAFQQAVWACLVKIPFGETWSYLDIAKMLNNARASQAVGGANGRNPISLIVPCHRVIGSSGALTGYAGGIERKLWLLKHEGIDVKPSKENANHKLQEVIQTRQAKTHFLI
jgi:methylated-DNA-[protein]-cysteine S-methyltransferase